MTEVQSAFAGEPVVVTAGHIRPGVRIANEGTAQWVQLIGVFVVVQIERRQWSLATGASTRFFTDRVWHVADEVAVDATSLNG